MSVTAPGGQRGHDVDSVGDECFRGLSRASSGEYAALILDRMLPGLDGLSLMKQFRANGVDDAGPASHHHGGH